MSHVRRLLNCSYLLMHLQHGTSRHHILPSQASTVHVQCMLPRQQEKKPKKLLVIMLNPLSTFQILPCNTLLMLYKKGENENSCTGGHHYTPPSPDALHFHEQTRSLSPYNTPLYNTTNTSKLFQKVGVLFLWLKTLLSANTYVLC